MGSFSLALTLSGLKLPWRSGDSSSSCVGIHFDGRELAAVRLDTTQERPRIDRAVRASIDPAASHANPARLAFQALLRDPILQGARLVVSLEPEAYETSTCAIPVGVPAEELKEALRWQLRESLPFPCDEAIIDFVRLPASVTRASASGHAFVVAARRLAVNALLEQFAQAGLRIAAVEIPELSQRNLMAASHSAIAGFVSFAGQTCLLTLQAQGELCFSRRMILPSRGDDGEIEPEHLADRIATNVTRSLEVFTRQSAAGEVASITVGPHVNAALIARCLQEQSTLDVTLFDATRLADGADPWMQKPVELGDRAGSPNGNALVIALGSAMREVVSQPASRRLRWAWPGLRRDSAALPGV